MSSDLDIDIEEHDLLEHPTLRGVFPDLSLVKQQVDYNDEEAVNEPDGDILNDSWHEKPSPLPYDPDEPEEPTQQNDVDETWPEKPVRPQDDPENDKSNDTTRQNDVDETWPEKPVRPQDDPENDKSNDTTRQNAVDETEKPARQPDDHDNEKSNDTTEQNGVDETWPEKPARQLDDHDNEKSNDTTKQNGVDETWPRKPACQPDNHDDEDSNDTLILEPEKVTEKPDSTTDLVVDSAHLSPSDSTLVTSSQCVIPNPTTPEITDESDYKDDEEAEDEEQDTFEDRWFESYVSLQDWGPYLDGSKLYCAECKILFATENAIAAHNMTDHSHLEEVSAPHYDEYQPKKYIYGSKLVHRCDKCPAKFTRFYILKKHKVVIHGEMLGESKYPNRGLPQSNLINVRTVATVSIPKANSVPTGKHLCQVCNTTLPSNEELIAHLYDHVTSQHKCEYCNALFSKKDQLEIHLLTHLNDRYSSSSSAIEGGICNSTSSTSVVNEHTSDSKSKLRERYGSDLPYYFMCHICSTCFQNGQFYTVHMLKFHKIRVATIPEQAKVSKLHCQQCKLTFEKIGHYNVHIKTKHILRKCNLCMQKFKWSLINIHKKKCPGRTIRTDSTSSTSAEPSGSSMNPSAIKVLPNTQTTHTDTQVRYKKTLPYALKCHICTKCFTLDVCYIAHMSKFHKKRVTTTTIPEQARVTELHCEPCNLTFSTVAHYNAHIMNVHHLRECNLCKQKYKFNLIHIHKKNCPGRTIRTDSTSSTSAEPSSSSMNPSAIKVLPNTQTTHTDTQVRYKKTLPYALKCHICTKCFTLDVCYIAHMSKFHKKRVTTTTIPEQARVTELHCEPCNLTFSTVAHYNAHIMNVHRLRECNLCKQKYKFNLIHIHKKKCPGRTIRTDSTSSTSAEPSSSSMNPSAIKLLPNTQTTHTDTQVRYKKTLPYALKCHICTKCFTLDISYIAHMSKFHKKHVTTTTIPEQARVTELHCEPCNLKFSRVTLYNAHILFIHHLRKCNLCKQKYRWNLKNLHDKKCSGRANGIGSAVSKNVLRMSNKLPRAARSAAVKLTDSHLKVHFVYKCIVCEETFPTYKSAWTHKDKEHRGAWKVIVRHTQKLILKKSATELNTRKTRIKNSETGNLPERRIKHILNVILQCYKCDFNFPSWGGAIGHMNRVCRDGRNFTCKICRLKFYSKSTRSHMLQHRYGEKLTVVKLNEYERNSHRILHNCVTCQVYMTARTSIVEHLSSHDVPDWQACTVCGYRIAGGQHVYVKHVNSHTEFNLSKNDYIIYRYAHTNETCQEAAVSSKEADSTSEEEEAPSKPVEKLSVLRRLIQCDTCKRHMTKKIRQHYNKNCLSTSSHTCPKCGLAFTTQSIINHISEHRNSSKPLTFRDFDIINYSGKKVTMNVSDIVRSLNKCKCGIVSHNKYDLNTHKMKCGTANCNFDEGVKCKICDVTYLKSSYTWHLMLHKRSTVPKYPKIKPHRSSENSTVPKHPKIQPHSSSDNTPKYKSVRNTLSYVRCDKCHVHILNRMQGIRKHRAFPCVKTAQRRLVCLKCGLIIPIKSQPLHENIHKSIQFTMKDLEILRMSNMKPVEKEICGFPHCNKCGLRFDSDTNQHKRDRCKSDDTPKTKCQTCGLTFTNDVYTLHLPYYGCDETSQAKKRKANEMDDSAEITKLISNYNRMIQARSQLYQCTECDVLVDSYDEVIKHCEQHQSPSYEVASFVCHVCDLNFDYTSFQRHKEQHFTRPGIERSCFEVLEFLPSKYKTSLWEFYQNAFTGNGVAYKLKQEGPVQHTLYQCAKCKNICSDKTAAYVHTTNDSYCLASSKVCKECGLTIQCNSIVDHEKYHQTNPYLASSSFRIIWFIKETTEVNEPTNEDHTVTVPNLSKPILYKCAKCNIHYPSKITAMTHSHALKGKRIRISHTTCKKCGLSFTIKSLKKHHVLHHVRAQYQRADFLIKIVRTDVSYNVPQSQSDNRLLNVVPKNYTARKDNVVVRKNQVIRKNLQSEKRAMASGNIKDKLVLDIPAKRVDYPSALGLPYSPVNKSRPTLYKCTHCDLHFLASTAAEIRFVIGHASRDHIGAIASEQKVCLTCNLTFWHESYAKHVYEHHQKADYKEEDFDIFAISSDKTFKVLPRRADSTINVDSDSDRSVINLETVEIEQSKRHNITKVPLYKCSLCNAHFWTETSIDKHFLLQSHSTADNTECDFCHYHFKGRSILQHENIHHKIRNLKTDDFQVVVRTPQMRDVVRPQPVLKPLRVLKPQRVLKTKRIRPGVVYKCAACVVCFVTQRTMQLHGYNHKVIEARDLKYCELCNMHFGKGTLKKHLNYHHPNGAAGNFKIVEVQPRKLNSAVNMNYNEMEMESTDSKASVSGQYYENVEFLDDDTVESVNQNQDVTPPVRVSVIVERARIEKLSQ